MMSALKEQDDNKQVGFLVGNHPADNKIPTRADLELAKDLLDVLMINVGILERYNESLGIFEHVTGNRIPVRTIQIQNQTNPSEAQNIDQKMRDEIRDRNILDQELYEYAVKILNRQVKNIPLGLEDRFIFEQTKTSTTIS